MRWPGLVTVVASALAAGACVTSSSVECSDGRWCPRDTVCVDDIRACVTAEQLASCEGQPDEATCTYAGQPSGICFGQVCIPSGCGNGKLEGTESCDDGNVDHGDGCSADCSSNELCGNGTVDVAIGEACDDGNVIDGDGCLASCAMPSCGDGIHDPQFSEECDAGEANSAAPDAPCRPNCLLPRCGDGSVDALAGEVCDDDNLSTGDGCSADCKSGETCGNGYADFITGEVCDDGNFVEHDGCTSTCTAETPGRLGLGTVRPARRWRHALAYDAARQRVIAFGGNTLSATGDLADTAQWDGTRWSTVPSTIAPPARSGHRLAYDLKRDAVVLFGGTGAGGRRSDTWELVGDQWSVRLAPTSPPPRQHHAMAYDLERGRIVVFGGDGADGLLGDTWEWDGIAWADVTPATGPAPRAHATMAYDPVHGEVVLFGGEDSGGARSDTWRFDGTSWQLSGATTPARTQHAMAFDTARARITVVGGLDASGTLSDETWEWDGTSWTERAVTGPGLPRREHAVAYDVARGRLVLFAGNASGPQTLPLRDDTWELGDGDAGWADVTPPQTGPSISTLNSALVYDVARKQSLYVLSSYSTGTQTWALTSRGWFQITTTTAPPTRIQFPMAYDSVRGVSVLFGGWVSGAANDTWELDGVAWTRRFPATSPGTRFDHVLAFDPSRNRMVMFGGNGAPNDTWEYDGTTWAQFTPAGSPPVRKFPGFAYAGNGTVMMFGGTIGTSTAQNDTWLWNGATWSQLAPTTVPVATARPAMTWDSTRARVVLTNSQGTWEWVNDDWLLVDQAARGGQLAFDSDRDGVLEMSGALIASWDGATWTSISATLGVVAAVSANAGLVYDRGRGSVIAFGVGRLDTLERTGAYWIDRMAASRPPDRFNYTVAYDPARDRTVLFGGSSTGVAADTSLFADTWQWNGGQGTWMQTTPATAPPARQWHAVAFDAARGKLVLFGGWASTTYLGDTWEWDGTTWTDRTPASGPSARREHRLAYDAKLQRVVLFGGRGESGALGDTWAWNGTSWTQLSSQGPGARRAFGMAYDPLRQRVVIGGGVNTNNDQLNDGWELEGATWSGLDVAIPDDNFVYDERSARLFGPGFLIQWNAGSEPLCRSRFDLDGDGRVGCADPDCWGACTPFCPPSTTCNTQAPRCGDAVCSVVEDCATCPGDCGACTAVCGDGTCSSPETMATCAGDCP